jgi:hypothetical protein
MGPRGLVIDISQVQILLFFQVIICQYQKYRGISYFVAYVFIERNVFNILPISSGY